MPAPERIDIEVGGKPYNISTISIPYFASYASLQCHSEEADAKHDDIPLFHAAYRGVESGFRQCFRMLGTDLTKYDTLCDTLDLLCIDTLGGRCIDVISRNLKSGKGRYDTEHKRSTYVKGDKSRARDNSFRLLYLLLRTKLEAETKTRQKMYLAVLFIVSHHATFTYNARKTIRAAYEERFHVSEKQRAALDKWPALQLGTGAAWSDHDVTTDDSSAHGLDSDDS